MWAAIHNAAHARTRATALVAFRILFCALMVKDMHGIRQREEIEAFFLDQTHNFHYILTPFVTRLPYAVFGWFPHVMGTLAALACVGVAFKFTMWSYAIGYLYLFLVEKSRYLNHAYLFCILAFCLALSDAGQYLTLPKAFRAWREGRLRAYIHGSEGLGATVPNWQYFLIKYQILLCYTYAGIAKCDWDWLLRGEPIRTYLTMAKGNLPEIVHPYLLDENLVYAMSAGGLTLDLFVGFCLWYGPTRWIGVLSSTAFHSTNSVVFTTIGSFPFVMMSTTLLFLDQDKFAARLSGRSVSVSESCVDGGGEKASGGSESENDDAKHAVSSGKSRDKRRRGVRRSSNPRRHTNGTVVSSTHAAGSAVVTALVVVYVVYFTLMPVRHHVQTDDVVWTQCGDSFSWRMLAVHQTGMVSFNIDDKANPDRPAITRYPSNNPRGEIVLLTKSINQMSIYPDMIMQLASWEAERAKSVEKMSKPRVRADVWRTFNGRPMQRWLDKNLDLAEEYKTRSPFNFKCYPFVLDYVNTFESPRWVTAIANIQDTWVEAGYETQSFIHRPRDSWTDKLSPRFFDHALILALGGGHIDLVVGTQTVRVEGEDPLSLPLGRPFEVVNSSPDQPAVFIYLLKPKATATA